MGSRYELIIIKKQITAAHPSIEQYERTPKLLFGDNLSIAGGADRAHKIQTVMNPNSGLPSLIQGSQKRIERKEAPSILREPGIESSRYLYN